MELATTLWFALGWFIGGFVHGITGFGSAMAAMPVVLQGMSIAVAVPACTAMTFIAGLEQCWRYRGFTDWPRVVPLLIGAVPGAFAGVLALRCLPPQYLKTALGLFLVCFALRGLFSQGGRRTAIHKAWGYVAGFCATAFGTAFSFNGPPLAVYTALAGWDKAAGKAGLAMSFILTCGLMLGAQILAGLHGLDTLLPMLAGVPCTLLGAVLGFRVSNKMSESAYRNGLFAFLGLTGAIFLWQVLG